MSNKEQNKTKDKYEIGDFILDAFSVFLFVCGIAVIHSLGGVLGWVIGGIMITIAIDLTFPNFWLWNS